MDTSPELKLSHFPSCLHAFIWRNWESVSIERMAKVLDTDPENLRRIGLSMGLPSQTEINDEYRQRGYISLIRRNWHLLDYNQLLVLLGWDSEQLDFTLRDDDFLWVKLGGMRPTCLPLQYIAPDKASEKRCEQIKNLVAFHFGNALTKPHESRFQFIKEISEPFARFEPVFSADSRDNSIRFIYSYFAPYGDSLLQPELEPFPEGLLQRLSEVGVNGVWLHVVLNQLAPSRTFPEFGKNYQVRLENLRKMTQRAKRYGIKIYLYINEPRAMPPDFFKGRGQFKGVHFTGNGNDLYALCTSVPEVRQWISDSLTLIFREVPELGGVFTITASENITNCWVHYEPQTCPRCSKRTGPEVVSEINRTIAEGVWRGNPNAKVICWDWGWKDEWIEPIIRELPDHVYYMTVSEWGLPINRGIPGTVTEYSISAVGPSNRSKHHWKLAKQRGLSTIAKIQINTTWELSTLPYLPVMNLIAQHCENLTKTDINGLMLSWTLGGSPSPNLHLAEQFFRQPKPTLEEALTTIAKERYGTKAVPDILNAWAKFSLAFTEYPFSQIFVYRGPMQTGPSNLLYPEPTGMKSTMVGFPFDDIKGWSGLYSTDNWQDKYGPDVLVSQFEKMIPIWQQGLVHFQNALDKKMELEQQGNTQRDYQIAEAAGLYFKSSANQIRFILARDEFMTGTSTLTRREDLLKTMESIATEELDIAKRFFVLSREDSRFGWEASNHYMYFPFDLIEKLINCDYILNDWLPRKKL